MFMATTELITAKPTVNSKGKFVSPSDLVLRACNNYSARNSPGNKNSNYFTERR
jgi:hypothetical protein